MKSKYAALWLLVTGLAFFALAASSPQCARSTDSLVGPATLSDAPDPVQQCQHDCDANARVQERAERKRHRAADKACNGDEACHVQEDALHAAILLEIEADRLGCRANCSHEQGSGVGGQ